MHVLGISGLDVTVGFTRGLTTHATRSAENAERFQDPPHS
jgi:hypothetical protein